MNRTVFAFVDIGGIPKTRQRVMNTVFGFEVISDWPNDRYRRFWDGRPLPLYFDMPLSYL